MTCGGTLDTGVEGCVASAGARVVISVVARLLVESTGGLLGGWVLGPGKEDCIRRISSAFFVMADERSCGDCCWRVG